MENRWQHAAAAGLPIILRRMYQFLSIIAARIGISVAVIGTANIGVGILLLMRHRLPSRFAALIRPATWLPLLASMCLIAWGTHQTWLVHSLLSAGDAISAPQSKLLLSTHAVSSSKCLALGVMGTVILRTLMHYLPNGTHPTGNR